MYVCVFMCVCVCVCVCVCLWCPVQLEQTRKRAEKAERQVQQLTHEVDFKNQELESIRSETQSTSTALSRDGSVKMAWLKLKPDIASDLEVNRDRAKALSLT